MITEEELKYIASQVEEGFQSGSMQREGRIVKWFIQITEEENGTH
jgi:hypothetical protein